MIIVVLPAYNEEKTIGSLLESLKEVMEENNLPYKTIIVDDGSTDKTSLVVKNFSQRMPIYLVEHPTNRGLAEAIKNGLVTAIKEGNLNDIIMTMDADNTHTPQLILRMVRMIKEGSDLVIGSRYVSGSYIRGVPWRRKILSQGASLLFRLFFPLKGVKDFTSGYRAYRMKIIKDAFERYGDNFINQPGFSCMVDILIKLRRLDPIINEAPLILRYDLKTSPSKMKIFKTIKETLSLLIKRRFGIYG